MFKFNLKLKTYDGDKIILYDDKQQRYIQIDEKNITIASKNIENLDDPDFVYEGKWEMPNDTCGVAAVRPDESDGGKNLVLELIESIS